MFDELIVRNVSAAGALLALLALLGPARFRWWAALPVGLAALGLIFGMGSLPSPVSDSLPLLQLGTLAAWLLFGLAARAARPKLPKSLGIASLVAGALMGDLAAALFLAPQAKDASTAVRVGLCCAAGGLLSPFGTPATLLLVDASVLAPIALPMALLAWPRGQHQAEGGSLPATGLIVTLALLAGVFAELRLPLLMLGAAMLLVLGRSRLARTLEDSPKALFGWLLAASLVAWAALHLGLLQRALYGLQATFDVMPELAPVLVGGVGGLLSLLVGEGAGALLADTLLGAGWTGSSESVRVALALGVGIGGLGPAWLASKGHEGRARALLLPFALQGVAALLWVSWFL